MTITARLNTEVEDYFFNEQYLLTVYFYCKVAICVVVILLVIRMRDQELHDDAEVSNEDKDEETNPKDNMDQPKKKLDDSEIEL